METVRSGEGRDLREREREGVLVSAATPTMTESAPQHFVLSPSSMDSRSIYNSTLLTAALSPTVVSENTKITLKSSSQSAHGNLIVHTLSDRVELTF